MATETPAPLNMIFVAERADDKQVALAVAKALDFPDPDKGTAVEVGMVRRKNDGPSTWVFAPAGKDAVFPGGAAIARIPDIIVTEIGGGTGKFRIETGRAFTADRGAFSKEVTQALTQPARNGNHR